MAYNWGIEDLIEAKEKLTIILKKEHNKKKRNYIKLIIESLSTYIDEEQINQSEKSETPAEEISYNDILANLEYDISSCREYYSLVSFFAHTTDSIQDKIDEIEDILSTRLEPDESYSKISGATITNERALSLTEEFYQNFSESLYPTFKDAFIKKENAIRYVNDIENNCTANSTYIDIIKKQFISIVKTNDLSKLYTFIHEYGHIISYIVNPQAMYYASEYIFNEVASLFPELVAQYENIGNFDKAHALFESYLNLILYRTKAINLDAHRTFITLWNNNNRQVDDNYMAKIQELEFDDDTFNDAIETLIDDEGTYIISYMVALDLLHIYKQDKKKALEIFNNFLNIPCTQSIRAYLESEIPIGTYLLEETESLVDSFKKELKKSGEFHV